MMATSLSASFLEPSLAAGRTIFSPSSSEMDLKRRVATSKSLASNTVALRHGVCGFHRFSGPSTINPIITWQAVLRRAHRKFRNGAQDRRWLVSVPAEARGAI